MSGVRGNKMKTFVMRCDCLFENCGDLSLPRLERSDGLKLLTQRSNFVMKALFILPDRLPDLTMRLGSFSVCEPALKKREQERNNPNKRGGGWRAKLELLRSLSSAATCHALRW